MLAQREQVRALAAKGTLAARGAASVSASLAIVHPGRRVPRRTGLITAVRW